ncbi:MAG: DoxX family protein [Kofleriaceae bacterium]|nr:DoxX family protein [Kofleriaceae bacterium]MCB9571508.1 DoxX family protein [Kofleriaceae bacterium]
MRLFYAPFATGRLALGLAVIRVLAGVALAFHGWTKIQNPLHWMDGMHDAAIGPLQAAAAASEFAGGIGLAVGLLTPLCCLGIIGTMAVAMYHHIGRGDAFVRPGKPSWELASVYASVAVGVLLAGPGRWSIDFLLVGRRRGELPPQ